MSNLMTNIRRASVPLQESSAHIGRLILQLGQTADTTLDAEALAELDKQAAVAACKALQEAADREARGEGGDVPASGTTSKEGGEEGVSVAVSGGDADAGDADAGDADTGNADAGDADADTGDDGSTNKEEEGGVDEKDATAPPTVELATVDLSIDTYQDESTSSSSNNNASGGSQHSANSQSGGDSIATANSSNAPSSLMQSASPSPMHVVTAPSPSHAAGSSFSSSRHTTPRGSRMPSPLPRSARSSRDSSMIIPGGILSASPPSAAASSTGLTATLSAAVAAATTSAATATKEPPPPPEAAAAASAPATPRKPSADGPVTVVLQGFDSASDEKVVVCESKALAHLFTRVRNRETPPAAFRFYASRMMRILVEEGIACLESSRQFITTPTRASFSSVFVDETNVCVVSVLRAGDALAEAAQACIPTAPGGKILIQRDEESSDKHPVLFYKKLPPKIATMQVLLCDPMLATGGSALMAIRCLLEAGVKESAIVFVTVVVCPEGLGAVRGEFPEVTIVTGAIDDCLNERRYILPGLGDFGDRFFGTVN